MVETVTAQSLQKHLLALAEQGLLTEALQFEISHLFEDSGKLSNWTDTRDYLKKGNYQAIQAGGPVSKVLRTLAWLLEQASQSLQPLKDSGVRLSAIALTETVSGCSNYQGRIEVTGIGPDGAEMTLLSGTFLWDCARHSLPQTQAAQQLGYRCMVSFPKFTIPACGQP